MVFDGFRWRIPTAFQDAVGQCTFAEGDTIHRDADHTYTLQVRHPKREASASREAQAAVFETNWQSECTVELYAGCPSVFQRRIDTTQGRLYCALWKDNLNLLDSDGDHPSLPNGAKELHSILRCAPEESLDLSDAPPAFVMAADLSNGLYGQKRQQILSHAQDVLSAEPWFIPASDLDAVTSEQFAPTTGFHVFPTFPSSIERLEESLKAALYSPDPNAKNPKFRLSAHGRIVS